MTSCKKTNPIKKAITSACRADRVSPNPDNMKKTLLFLFFTFAVSGTAFSQNHALRRQQLIDHILSRNTTIKALRATMAGEKAEARTDGALPDPEIGYAYSWGAPATVPAKQNVEVSQPLDWGTLSGRRKSLARAGENAAEMRYLAAVREVKSEVDRALVRATFCNRICAEQTRKVGVLQAQAEAMDKRFMLHATDTFSIRRTRLALALAQADLCRAEAERTKILAEISRLAGGENVEYTDTVYVLPSLPPLSDILASVKNSHPTLSAARAETEESKARLRLNRALGLPALSVGFTGEYVSGERHSGVSLGMSIPLWGNSRRRTAADRAALQASEEIRADLETRMESEAKSAYSEAVRLTTLAEDLRQSLSAVNDMTLVQRAYEVRHIDFHGFMDECAFISESRLSVIEAERDAALAVSAVLSLVE